MITMKDSLNRDCELLKATAIANVYYLDYNTFFQTSMYTSMKREREKKQIKLLCTGIATMMYC